MPLQQDQMIVIEGASLQHGPLSQRIYLMKIGNANPLTLIPKLKALAQEKNYTKIFTKVPQSVVDPFVRAGYQVEAIVPRFFNRTEDGCFLGCYFSNERQIRTDTEKLDEILELARSRTTAGGKIAVPTGFNFRRCTEDDVEEMGSIYAEVFPTYPFPIDDPSYLRETMQSHVEYFGLEKDGKLVALSSAEKDTSASNVEMTDFATLPQWRNQGLAVCLLFEMEQAMSEARFSTAYTIARAISAGMNITFAKMGYQYGGRLINNTNISGTIESMNVWHKQLG